MGQERRRICASCGEGFVPDPRNARHQRYYAQPACRAVSKRASQAKWLAKRENRDYHRGSAAVARVRVWRQAHPSYSRRKAAVPIAALLAGLVSRGELRPHDTDYASWQLFNLCFGSIHIRLLFGLIREVSPQELEAHLGRAVDDFLVL